LIEKSHIWLSASKLPLGSNREEPVDIRILSATHQDLDKRVQDGRFREDFLYRLKVVSLQLPPLRDRREDIPILAQHYLRIYAAKNNRRLDGFTRELAPLVLNGPPSVTGFAGGRPKVEEIVAYWPALIDKSVVQTRVEVL
jgi:transcriptional regulator with AAA-type ATPase domain